MLCMRNVSWMVFYLQLSVIFKKCTWVTAKIHFFLKVSIHVDAQKMLL